LDHEFSHFGKDLDKNYIKYIFRKDAGKSSIKFDTLVKISSLFIEDLDFIHECKKRRIIKDDAPVVI